MSLQVSKSGIVHYFLIYLLLISTRAAIFFQYRTVCEYVIIAVCVFCSLKYTKLRSSVLYRFFIALYMSLYLTRFVVGSGWGLSTYINIISVVWIGYVAYNYNADLAVYRFIKAVIFFATISLVCWVMLVVSPETLGKLFISDYDLFYGSKGLLFFVYRYVSRSHGDMRNVGIFTEPGIYQIVLNATLFLLLFYKEKAGLTDKMRWRYIVITILTILSAQSTSGYLALGIILIGYIFIKGDTNKGKIIAGISIAVLILGVDYLVNQNESLLATTVLNKLFTDNSLDLSTSTGFYRVNTIVAGWEIFKQNPLGAGNNYYKLFSTYTDGYTGSGGGLFLLLGTCGIITTLIIMALVFVPAYKNRKSMICFILYAFMYINTVLAQSMTVYAVLVFLSLIKDSNDNEYQELRQME